MAANVQSVEHRWKTNSYGYYGYKEENHPYSAIVLPFSWGSL